MDSALIQAIFNTSTGCGISNTTTAQSLETSDCNMHQTVFIICHSIQIPLSISPSSPLPSPKAYHFSSLRVTSKHRVVADHLHREREKP